MTVKEALRKAIETLTLKGVQEARLEAEILLRHLLAPEPLLSQSPAPEWWQGEACQGHGIGRAELHIRLEDSLPPEQTQELERLIRRRLRHEPIAYITGHKEFFGLDIRVSYATLIPRPETELLVEKALELAGNRTHQNTISAPIQRPSRPSIADVGTGCGAIAIALAVHLPQAEVYAIDISAATLKVAALNCERHQVTGRVHLLQGDLLQPLTELAHEPLLAQGPSSKPCQEQARQGLDLILANLPYVSDREMQGLSDEVLFEPALALSGGLDGLRQISRLLAQAKDILRPGGSILLEISPKQRTSVVKLTRRHFPGAVVKVFPDLSGHDRMIAIESKGER